MLAHERLHLARNGHFAAGNPFSDTLTQVAVTVGQDMSELVTTTRQNFPRIWTTKEYGESLVLSAPVNSDTLLSPASESAAALQPASSRRTWTILIIESSSLRTLHLLRWSLLSY